MDVRDMRTVRSLQAPTLDDRNFQAIVDELKRRIPLYCPEWTDHNVSDPGIMLIELFAWVAEGLLYQMNQIPELHFIKLMELLGIHPEAAQAARVPVTFWLTKDHQQKIVIGQGFEVASTQTEQAPPIVFTTEKDLVVNVSSIGAIVRRQPENDTPTLLNWAMAESRAEDRREEEGSESRAEDDREEEGKVLMMFDRRPSAGHALEFGFDADISCHVLQFSFDLDPKLATGPNEMVPESWPYVWETLTDNENDEWQLCDCEFDETKALRYDGKIQIHLPVDAQCVVRDGQYWIRMRIIDGQNIKGFDTSPGLMSFPKAVAVGGVVWARHGAIAKEEIIGSSNGLPGQRFQLAHENILTKPSELTIRARSRNETYEEWYGAESFSFPTDTNEIESRCFTLVPRHGEIRFAPALRQVDGQIQQYGPIPSYGTTLEVVQYAYGGGTMGNVPRGKLDTPKTSDPRIARVLNRRDASGGLDAEEIDTAMLRVPLMLGTQERAVTAHDFELHAMRAAAAVVRTKCLVDDTSSRSIKVFALRHKPVGIASLFPVSRFRMSESEREEIQQHLDERRMLTVRVTVEDVVLQPVAVELLLDPAISIEYASRLAEIRETLLAQLAAFIDPWTGGDERRGWPFGRSISSDDVWKEIRNLPESSLVRHVELFVADLETGDAIGSPQSSIGIEPHMLLISGKHKIRHTES